MDATRKNVNRGYQQLRVWADAVELYRLTWVAVEDFPYVLKRVASQQVASVDSIHRNIAEGYCRRSINEYIQHLYVALGSLGESVSSLMAMGAAGQLPADQRDALDALAFKIENGLIKLVASLEAKRQSKDWVDHMIIRESNELYDSGHHSGTPPLQYSQDSSP